MNATQRVPPIINRGDRVEIKSMGTAVVGIVRSASNYSTRNEYDNWYIEIVDDSGMPHYWKQEFDGGTVRKLEKEEK